MTLDIIEIILRLFTFITFCIIAIPCKDADLAYWKMKVNLNTLEIKNANI